jgi:hypothetical protein
MLDLETTPTFNNGLKSPIVGNSKTPRGFYRFSEEYCYFIDFITPLKQSFPWKFDHFQQGRKSPQDKK